MCGVTCNLRSYFKAPIQLFKKDVISFLIIRRYDLGILHEKLHYIAVKPSASISALRRKVWHLLDLPDYCEEVIVLKTQTNVEIPLTDLRRGNGPQNPFILEVWLPGEEPKDCASYSMLNNMLSIGQHDAATALNSADLNYDEKNKTNENNHKRYVANYVMSTDSIAQIKHKVSNSVIYPHYKTKTQLSCKSKTSLFRLHGKKSQDNFVNILMKIQSELSALSSKISVLESKFDI